MVVLEISHIIRVLFEWAKCFLAAGSLQCSMHAAVL